VNVVDRCAGPGGWDEGVRPLGLSPLGVELNPVANATGEAAGHRRIRGDVAKLDPYLFGRVDGLIGSPPCPGWTVAGSGRSREDSVHVLEALEDVAGEGTLFSAMENLAPTMAHPETLLALEPLRWCLTLHPRWTAWEQVPTVLPLWRACAPILQALGYSVATGNLHAEQYGVPQTRKRAVLIASREHAVRLPEPTHSRFHPHDPQRLDPGVKPWLSMRDVIDVRGARHMVSNYGTGGDPRKRGVRTVDQPAATVTGKVNRNRWAHGGRVTVAEAAALQTFPAGYPFQGTGPQQYQQIGDAVPPVLAGRIVAAAMGVGE
jgi:DNA (cytosine-5)-methyltransferase 1